MVVDKVILQLLFVFLIDATVIPVKNNNIDNTTVDSIIITDDSKLADIFDGVYSDCLLRMSYTCLQRKTLVYLNELNKLREISVVGDYVKFVKFRATTSENQTDEDTTDENDSEKLSLFIDRAVDMFFDNHIIKFSALGRNMSIPNSVEGFVGRKKRKGGGGGGGHGGFGHDDGGKKKMMMMAMMCMKMKLMMMVPAMMGMMGMMSFKGMMFSMMSFMISKMMLLMKILEKKGSFGGGGGGGDGGWAAGGGGGAWMPAGGQDYGGGGGYDSNGQWQSRSIIDKKDNKEEIEKEPIISYVIPSVRYNNINVKANDINGGKIKSRKKRGIFDALQNIYSYWINQILGAGNRRNSNNHRYKVVNGVKYVYYPNKVAQKFKIHQDSHSNPPKMMDQFKPIIIADDFNKGETIEGGVESRMNMKKIHKIKDTVNETFDENPWM